MSIAETKSERIEVRTTPSLKAFTTAGRGLSPQERHGVSA